LPSAQFLVRNRPSSEVQNEAQTDTLRVNCRERTRYICSLLASRKAGKGTTLARESKPSTLRSLMRPAPSGMRAPGGLGRDASVRQYASAEAPFSRSRFCIRGKDGAWRSRGRVASRGRKGWPWTRDRLSGLAPSRRSRLPAKRGCSASVRFGGLPARTKDAELGAFGPQQPAARLLPFANLFADASFR
jgi:hypothetical protein